MNDVSIKKKIIADLNKSGFPTEVKITAFLDKSDWTFADTLFEDSDKGKHREIDINVVYVDYSLADTVKRKVKEGNENKLISHLIIEIKKSDKPWVFFDNGRIDWPWILPQNFKSLKKDFHYTLIEDLKKLGLNAHRYEKEILHKSHHVSFSSPSQPSVIYEALIKTSKALRYYKKKYGVGGCTLHLFIPMIILEGNLWSASLNKKGSINLKEVESLLVTHSDLIKHKKLGEKFEEQQICDVVTVGGFKNRLKTIHVDNKEIYKAWTTYLNRGNQKKKKG